MPFAALLIGIILLISVIRNTYSQFGQALVQDFTGSGNFIYWVAAIAIVGFIGYASPGFEKVSRAFLGLIILAMFLANKGIYTSFVKQLKMPQAVQATPEEKVSGPAPIKLEGAGGSGGILGSLGGLASTVGKIAGGIGG